MTIDRSLCTYFHDFYWIKTADAAELCGVSPEEFRAAAAEFDIDSYDAPCVCGGSVEFWVVETVEELASWLTVGNPERER